MHDQKGSAWPKRSIIMHLLIHIHDHMATVNLSNEIMYVVDSVVVVSNK
jgi:hypothetical protein